GCQHVVEQPRPGSLRLDDREPPGLAVVRRRSREGRRDRAAYRGLVHRLVSEIPYSSAFAKDVGGAPPEPVFSRWPNQGGCARTVAVGDDIVGQAPYHRDRHLVALALDEFGGSGDLVGHGRNRHLKQVAETIGLTAVVTQRQHAGRSNRHVGLAVAPWAAHGVRDEHADVGAGQVTDRLAQPPRRSVGVLREQNHRARRGVGPVDAGGREDQALLCLGDRGRAPPGNPPDSLCRYCVLAVGADHAPLGLADDLRCDDEDVAVGEVRNRGRDQLREAGAWRYLGQASYAGDGDLAHPESSLARSTAAAAIAEVADASVMNKGRARTAMPLSSDAPIASASEVSTSQPSRSAAP